MESAGPQAPRVHPRLGGEDPLHELGLGHLQAEQDGRLAQLHRDVRGEVGHQGGLPHRRPRSDDDEVRRLQAAGELVEVQEAGRQAGDRGVAVVQPLDELEALGQHLLHRLELADAVALGDLEHEAL